MLKVTKDNKHWWSLLVIGIAFAMGLIDQYAVAVALPSLQLSLHLTDTTAHWVINIYLLTLASSIILAGRLLDYVSPRNLLVFSVAGFGISSMLCALSPNGADLIVARGLQGLFAGFMVPAPAVIILSLFPSHQVARANGIRLTFSALSITLGPILGGFITQYFGWSGIFWINVPIAVLVIIFSFTLIPDIERINQDEKGIDWLGFLLSSIGIVFITTAIMQSPEWGFFASSTMSFLLLGILALCLLVRIEKRHNNPYIHFALFRNRYYALTVLVVLLIRSVSILSVFWPIFFQRVLHVSPATAGLMMLPNMFTVAFVGPLAGFFTDKFGPKSVATVGVSCSVAALVLMLLSIDLKNYYLILPLMVLNIAGMVSGLNSVSVTALQTIAKHRRGIASGVSSFNRQLGAVLGMSAMGAILAGLLQKHTYVTAFHGVLWFSLIAALLGLYCIRRLPVFKVAE